MTPFATLLARELELVTQFLSVLEAEQEALKQGDGDRLPALTETKLTLVQRLDAADRQRGQYLAERGQGTDSESIGRFLALPENSAARPAWQLLLDKAAHARTLNLVNGQLIAQRLNATQQALDTLTHHTPKSRLYGPDGQSGGFSGSRISESA